MKYEYTIRCPQCGHTEHRIDEESLVWRGSDGEPPTSFGEEVTYQGHRIVGGEIVPTGQTIPTTTKCPKCAYGYGGNYNRG